MIKAIETVYNDHLFRSRLEARWAVFFNALGVRYEYELEGFDLHYNGKYLPDFYLPTFKAHLEIKPLPDDLRGKPEWYNKDASKKARELSIALKDTFVLIAFGDPLEHRACWFENGFVEYPEAAIYFTDERGVLCPTFYDGQVVDNGYNGGVAMEYDHRKEAITARQARFEHH